TRARSACSRSRMMTGTVPSASTASCTAGSTPEGGGVALPTGDDGTENVPSSPGRPEYRSSSCRSGRGSASAATCAVAVTGGAVAVSGAVVVLTGAAVAVVTGAATVTAPAVDVEAGPVAAAAGDARPGTRATAQMATRVRGGVNISAGAFRHATPTASP